MLLVFSFIQFMLVQTAKQLKINPIPSPAPEEARVLKIKLESFEGPKTSPSPNHGASRRSEIIPFDEVVKAQSAPTLQSNNMMNRVDAQFERIMMGEDRITAQRLARRRQDHFSRHPKILLPESYRLNGCIETARTDYPALKPRSVLRAPQSARIGRSFSSLPQLSSAYSTTSGGTTLKERIESLTQQQQQHHQKVFPVDHLSRLTKRQSSSRLLHRFEKLRLESKQQNEAIPLANVL
jgi:hypothetical protein